MSKITNIYGIFGNPASHSLSPVIHNTGFQKLNIDSQYFIFEPDTIKNAISGMRGLKLKGASVTIPFKEDVMNYIDEIDPLAKNIGSVNTLVNNNGIIKGYNTDGYGAYKSLINEDVIVKESSILVLGNGGSSRAIAFTLLEKGANITICGRNKDKVENLCSDLSKYNKKVSAIIFSDLSEELLNNMDIIINTTPIGMGKQKELTPLDTSLLNSSHVVFDIVYSPNETLLLKEASQKGCKVIFGINMLIFQGIQQFEIWTGKKAPYELIKYNLEKAINCSQLKKNYQSLPTMKKINHLQTIL